MAASDGFWSRRKAAVQAEARAEVAATQAAAEVAQVQAVAAEQAGKTDAQILQDLGLPDPETLVQGDDFAAFMGRAVPEHLRRRALRKLWVSNPILANLDGLVDHGEDYTDAATVIPGMQTAYQVGKGMLQHVIALTEAQPKAEAKEVAVESPVETAAQDNVTDAKIEIEEPALESLAVMPAPPQPEDVQRPRRHMRFEFVS